MDRYLELRVLPDPEFAPTAVLNALFAKLHRTLALRGTGTVGLSFPGFHNAKPTLGDRLRLHGTSAALEPLDDFQWLDALRDHLHTIGPAPVPQVDGYRIVRRVQVKSSPERLRRRLIARRGIPEADAKQAIPDEAARRSPLPYLTVTSGSTAQTFRIFVQHGPLVPEPVGGRFSAYGLSPAATIPWF